VIGKIVRALILIPLAIILIAFALANRQPTLVSFDPFDPANPAVSLTLPLFVLIIALLILGVIIGGMAAWLRQNKWRRAARNHEAEARRLQMELDAHKGRYGSEPGDTAPRRPHLTIPPPAA
jgi:uncharacterized integral membrane protein